MSNTTPTTTTPESIRRPLFREPNAWVENVYAIPGTETVPDLDSQDVMSKYLIDRFLPDEDSARFHLAMKPSGFTLPGITRIPNGFKQITRWRRTSEWLITPRAATAVTLGSLALFNLVGNHDTITGAAEAVGHDIYRIFYPVKDKTVVEQKRVVTPGKVETIDVTADMVNQVGSKTVDPAKIQEFITKVDKARRDGATVKEFKLKGEASDEWSDDNSIGVADTGKNDKLAADRAEAALEELVNKGLETDSVTVSVNGEEHILSQDEKDDIKADAEAERFPSIKSAVSAVDQNRPVSSSLAQKIKRLFTDRRGVSMTAVVEYPGKEVVTFEPVTRTEPDKDNPPHVPDADFYGLVPLLPIRKRERYTKVKGLHRWKFTPSKRLYRPTIIREDQDQAWVRIRPEAVNVDGTLADNAWAYTRAYENLMRDNRIADVLRADFKNFKGEDRSLRVMFVDQSPAKETLAAFESLLEKFAAMEDGKLGERVSGIFVYPSENAGTLHGDPKRMGMGLDKQSPAEILGTFTYVLKMVELHMPTTWSAEELFEMFTEFNDPTWVVAHEVAGHGTDMTDVVLRLQQVRTRNIPNSHIVIGEPRARKMSRLNGILSRLPRTAREEHHPIQFDIEYSVQDMIGQTVTMRERVQEDDPRLAHATKSTIVGYRPTQYAGTNESEHYAETAASVTTGKTIPYSQARVTVPQLQADGGGPAVFEDSYHPEIRGQKVFTDSVGAIAGSFPVEFANPPKVTFSHIHPENDSSIQREIARASHVRTLRPEQMVAILARIAHTVRRKAA